MPISLARLGAILIDFTVGCVIASIVTYVLTGGSDGIIPVSVYLVIFTVIMFFRDCVFKNASIGRRICHIHVVYKETRAPAKLSALLIRNLTQFVYPLEILALIAIGERLGDKLAKTEVEFVPEKKDGDSPRQGDGSPVS